jgi:hypothetical protein
VCTPIKASWPVPGVARAQTRLRSPTTAFRNTYVSTAKNNRRAVPVAEASEGSNRNVCASLIYPISGGGGGGPLEAIWTPNGTGRYSIRIFNSNNVTDDSWDIYINNVNAFNYDGGSSTSFTWTADLPLGPYQMVGHFVAANNMGNFFSWEVSKDGSIIASGDASAGDGSSGDTLTIGDFFATP